MTPVARVTAPADLAACVPELLGFVPAESLVVLALHEPRGRLGLTLRFDLVDGDLALADVPDRLVRAGATRAALVAWSEEAGDLPHAALVDGLVAGIRERGLRVTEALLVRDGRWFSYLCDDECCPREGSPLTPADTGVPGLMAAERVLRGERVRGSREELEQLVAPVLPLGERARLAELEAAGEALLERVLEDRLAAEEAELAFLRVALADPAGLDGQATARAAVALRLVRVRDEVLGWVAQDDRQRDRVRELALVLCRSAPCTGAAPALTVLGAAEYARGGGALARIALEAALAADPDARMAALLLTAFDGQLPPEEVRLALRPGRRRRRGAA